MVCFINYYIINIQRINEKIKENKRKKQAEMLIYVKHNRLLVNKLYTIIGILKNTQYRNEPVQDVSRFYSTYRDYINPMPMSHVN